MNRLSRSVLKATVIIAAVLFFMGCEKADRNLDTPTNVSNAKGGGGKGGGGGEVTSVGNNLSFPVIWAEGVTLPLRVPPAGYNTNDVVLNGAWWYVWGVDPASPSGTIYSCQPNPASQLTCLNGSTPGDGSTVYKAFLQNDAGNYWQASTLTAGSGERVDVNSIDWGDNLESSDWSLTSKVRTEVVLYQNVTIPVTEYGMRHTSGWGSDEMHGLQTTTAGEVTKNTAATQATIYSRHARLTIQKLFTNPSNLTWDPVSHSWTGDVNVPVFSKAVWQAGDGPGFYNAEVNVKGKIIYGYTWDVNKLNNGAGEYRITFSFDGDEAGTTLNTHIVATTEILASEVEGIVPAAEGGGNTAHTDVANNLTYIDVAITGGGKGGGSGHGGGSGNGGGGGKGKGGR